MSDGNFRAECALIMWIWQNVDYEDQGCIFNQLLPNYIEIHTSNKACSGFFKDTRRKNYQNLFLPAIV